MQALDSLLSYNKINNILFGKEGEYFEKEDCFVFSVIYCRYSFVFASVDVKTGIAADQVYHSQCRYEIFNAS